MGEASRNGISNVKNLQHTDMASSCFYPAFIPSLQSSRTDASAGHLMLNFRTRIMVSVRLALVAGRSFNAAQLGDATRYRDSLRHIVMPFSSTKLF